MIHTEVNVRHLKSWRHLSRRVNVRLVTDLRNVFTNLQPTQ